MRENSVNSYHILVDVPFDFLFLGNLPRRFDESKGLNDHNDEGDSPCRNETLVLSVNGRIWPETDQMCNNIGQN